VGLTANWTTDWTLQGRVSGGAIHLSGHVTYGGTTYTDGTDVAVSSAALPGVSSAYDSPEFMVLSASTSSIRQGRIRSGVLRISNPVHNEVYTFNYVLPYL